MGSRRKDDVQDPDQYEMIDVPIDLLSILDYFKDDRRTMEEGLKLERAKSVHNVHLFKVGHGLYHIRGQCLSGHDVTLVREFELTLAADHDSWILDCSCPAGKSGRCKHVMAGVRTVERARVLPLLTCTDVAQQWGKPIKNRQVQLEPIVNMNCCIDRIVPVVPEFYDAKEQERFLNVLLKACPQSALAKLKNSSRVRNLPIDKCPQQVSDDRYLSQEDYCSLIQDDINCVDETSPIFADEELENLYYNNIHIDLEKSVDIQSAAQNSPIWKKERQLRITASNCYQLFTYTQNRNADWDKKFNNISKAVMTKSTEYGKATEKIAFERYKMDEPLVKLAGLCINPKQPWLGCSPDGIVPSKKKIIEIKCPKAFEKQPVTLKDVKFLRCVSQNGSSEYVLKSKHSYFGQIQLNMYLLNCSSADLVIYSKSEDNYERIQVDYDEEFVLTMISALEKVYFEIFLPLINQKQLVNRNK